MNNRFKFRVWDTFHKQWIGACAIKFDGTIIDVHNAEPETNCIAQQYTGFKDADGNEIYEGDILKNLTPTKYSDVNFIVEWGEFEPSDDMGVGGVGFVLPWFFTTFKPKVIGNIFENPELLY